MAITASPHEVVFCEHGDAQSPVVSVVVPLFNYEKHINATLDSIHRQNLESIELLIVNDASTDSSEAVALSWLSAHEGRFINSRLIRHQPNAGLSCARNTGAVLAASDLIFFVDADNLIYPRCVATHVEALAQSQAAFAYSILEMFENERGIMGAATFSRNRFKKGNYIDAMALIKREHLKLMGGYKVIREGWEDYDLWLRLEEAGHFGIHIPEILGRYRVHGASMLRTNTNTDEGQYKLIKQFNKTFPWLELPDK
ncbi:MAG: glycosyltransferase family 2 protein [Gammaproteobacteria bacterium]|nr:glycosyltransferase family 2 protein [Gammaproteobacteria bacterium]MCH1550210.1 glycosyltransferase family 2 protein [Pseudomonadales bacterium]